MQQVPRQGGDRDACVLDPLEWRGEQRLRLTDCGWIEKEAKTSFFLFIGLESIGMMSQKYLDVAQPRISAYKELINGKEKIS